jgi:2,3-bisphosphoglycerate-independent phosphoglycerate mutase
MKRPVALIVLDGFGLAPAGPGNAVAAADTPNFDALWATLPHTTLEASGPAVGLPEGQMGNSEVGHLNLGAGRVVPQSLAFIQRALDRGELVTNPVFRRLCTEQLRPGGTLHLLGLLSDGGVHSDLRHLLGLIAAAQQLGVTAIAVHAFSDGRDTAPDGARGYLQQLETGIAELGAPARVATLIGRYHAMDRDHRWERTERAWEAIVDGVAPYRAANVDEAISAAYTRGETDEFVTPTLIGAGAPVLDGDAIFMFNFRADRARQLLHAFVRGNEWQGFHRHRIPDCGIASLMELDASTNVPFALAQPALEKPLAEVIADAHLRQFHAAETEKYPHVTYFFNAKNETPYPGESRYLEPSPAVATYDLQPAMSAPALARACAERIASAADDFVLINFANPDMVGHTGVFEAAVAACSATDVALGVVLEALMAQNGVALVVADHGNAEQMLTPGGKPHTAHTTNPVPCLLVGAPAGLTLRDGGMLGDVAPTLLELMDLAQPAAMTGRSLLQRRGER